MMKVGTSALAAEIALTHTGALVGDDRLVDAALRQWGIVRVRSLEELPVTAALLAHTGPLPPGGLGVVSISGGACDVIADRAEPRRPAPPRARRDDAGSAQRAAPRVRHDAQSVRHHRSASANPQLFAAALEAVAADPSVAALAAVHILPSGERGERFRPRLEVIAGGPGPPASAGSSSLPAPATSIRRLRESSTRSVSPTRSPGSEMPSTPSPTPSAGRHGCGGLPHPSRQAASSSSQTGAATGPSRAASSCSPSTGSRSLPGGWYGRLTKRSPRRAGSGTPSWSRSSRRRSCTRATSAASRCAIGSDDEVREAFDRVIAAGSRVAGARVEGAIVAAMWTGGIEMIVGVVCDQRWGPTLAVGFGGVWVHVLEDTSLRLPPVGAEDVREMLDELRGKALPQGVRGSTGQTSTGWCRRSSRLPASRSGSARGRPQ